MRAYAWTLMTAALLLASPCARAPRAGEVPEAPSLAEAAARIVLAGGTDLDKEAQAARAWAAGYLRAHPVEALALLAKRVEDPALPWPILVRERYEYALALLAPRDADGCAALARQVLQRAQAEAKALDDAEEGRTTLRETQALTAALQLFLKERNPRPQDSAKSQPAPGPEPLDPATQARARTAVAGLASEQFSEREAASETLRALGTAAVPALRAALNHPDAEVRARARELLTGLEAPPPSVQASAFGRYRGLLRVIEVPEDESTYGAYRDYGPWSGSSWKGHEDLPAGHWVYVAPKWYIWKEEWAPSER